MIITEEEIIDFLKKQDFVVWKWGSKNSTPKMEGFLDSDICEEIIGINEKCFVAILINENEARFIPEKKFINKVQGHDKQFPIERIIFGENRERFIEDGEYILVEKILPLNLIIDYLEQKEQ